MKKISVLIGFIALIAIACGEKNSSADMQSEEITVEKEVIIAQEKTAQDMETASMKIEQTSKELDELLNEI